MRRRLLLARALTSLVTRRSPFPPVGPPAVPPVVGAAAGALPPGTDPGARRPAPIDKPTVAAHYRAMAEQAAYERHAYAVRHHAGAVERGEVARDAWRAAPVAVRSAFGG